MDKDQEIVHQRDPSQGQGKGLAAADGDPFRLRRRDVPGAGPSRMIRTQFPPNRTSFKSPLPLSLTSKWMWLGPSPSTSSSKKRWGTPSFIPVFDSSAGRPLCLT